MKNPTKSIINKNAFKLQEMIHDTIRARKVKTVAAEMGVKASKLGNEINEYYNNAKWEATELYRYTAIMKDTAILNTMERMLGRVAVDLPHSECYAAKSRLSIIADVTQGIAVVTKMLDDIHQDTSERYLDTLDSQIYKTIRTLLCLTNKVKDLKNQK